jgi:proline iminopeptidase
LKLDRYLIVGHSAYGIVALEFIKRYPQLASAILMIGTPLNSNAEVAAQNNEIFKKLADTNRKVIDAKRREEVTKENLSFLSPGDRFLREYIYRDAPRYWHIPDYDCSSLWKGIVPDKLLERFFAEILPAVDVRKDLETIQVPIFLAAGLSDFDCCPWVWNDLPSLPPHMTISFFKQSGHWPQLEEPELFDKKVIEWYFNLHKKNLLT